MATAPFALCVKRSEVNLAKVEGDGEREREEIREGEDRWAWPAQISQCVESEPNPRRQGEGKARSTQLQAKSVVGNVVFVATHTCGTYMLLLLLPQACCTNTLTSNCASRRSKRRRTAGGREGNLCSAQQ